MPTAEIGAAFAQFDADTKPTLTKRNVKAVKGALTPAPGEATMLSESAASAPPAQAPGAKPADIAALARAEARAGAAGIDRSISGIQREIMRGGLTRDEGREPILRQQQPKVDLYRRAARPGLWSRAPDPTTSGSYIWLNSPPAPSATTAVGRSLPKK